MFIFFTTLYNIFKDNNHYIPSNNINDLLHLTDIIIDILRQQKYAFIWDICESNKNYSLDILNINIYIKRKDIYINYLIGLKMINILMFHIN